MHFQNNDADMRQQATVNANLENDSYRNHVTVEIRAIVKLDYRLYYLLLKHMKISEFCKRFSSISHRFHFENLRKLSKADQPQMKT